MTSTSCAPFSFAAIAADRPDGPPPTMTIWQVTSSGVSCTGLAAFVAKVTSP